MPLLTPPAGVDSLLLLEQMHYWPRWYTCIYICIYIRPSYIYIYRTHLAADALLAALDRTGPNTKPTP